MMMSQALVPYEPPAVAAGAGGCSAAAPPGLVAPLARIPRRLPRGLLNQGATCYLNSLTQTLFMTPEFRRLVYLWQYAADKDGVEDECVPLQLQVLFGQLQLASARAVSTRALTASFGWSGSDAFQQHDVQELARVLFDALEKALAGTRNSALINNLFRGVLRDYLQCNECRTERARDDAILDLSLTLKPFGSDASVGSIEEALDDFVKPEVLDGSNCVSCDACGRKTPHTKGLKLQEPPYLLQLQLKRFVFDFETMNRCKLNDRVTFPLLLDLNRFVSAPGAAPATPAEAAAVGSDSGAGGKVAGAAAAADESGGSDDCTAAPPPLLAAAGGGDDASTPSTHTDVEACSVVTAASPPDPSSSPPNDDAAAAAAAAAARPLMEQARELLAARGPHIYELYAVLVHSGSAMGGHYYAYIRDLDDADGDAAARPGDGWCCYNDGSVEVATLSEVLATAGGGGGGGGSGGSVSSRWAASSANAYMLMYRRVLLTPHVEIRGGSGPGGGGGGGGSLAPPAAADAAPPGGEHAPAPPGEEGAALPLRAAAAAVAAVPEGTSAGADAAPATLGDDGGGSSSSSSSSTGDLRRERSASGSLLYAAPLVSMPRSFPTDEEVPAAVRDCLRREAEEVAAREAREAEARSQMRVRVHLRDGVHRDLHIKRTASVAAATEAAWRLFHLDGTAATPRSAGPSASPSASCADRDLDSVGISALFDDSHSSRDDDASGSGKALPPLEPLPLACVRLRHYAPAHDLPKEPLSYNPRPVPAAAADVTGVPSYHFATFVGAASSAGSGSGTADGEPQSYAAAAAAASAADGWPPDVQPVGSEPSSGSPPPPPAAAAAAAAAAEEEVECEDGSQRTLEQARVFSYTDLLLETRATPDARWPEYDPSAVALRLVRFLPHEPAAVAGDAGACGPHAPHAAAPAATAAAAGLDAAAPGHDAAAEAAAGLDAAACGSLLPPVRVLVPRDCTLAHIGAVAAAATGIPRARLRLLRVSTSTNSVTAHELLSNAALGLVSSEPGRAEGGPPPPPLDAQNRVVGDTLRVTSDLGFRILESFTLYVEERAAAPPEPAAAVEAEEPGAPAAATSEAGAGGQRDDEPVAPTRVDDGEPFDPFGTAQAESQSAAAAAAAAARPKLLPPVAAAAADSGLVVTNHHRGGVGSGGTAYDSVRTAWVQPVERGFRAVSAATSPLVALLEAQCFRGTWRYNVPGEGGSPRSLVLDTRWSGRQVYAALAHAMGLAVGSFAARLHNPSWGALLKLGDTPGALRSPSAYGSKDGTLFTVMGPALAEGEMLVSLFLHTPAASGVIPGTAWLPPLLPPPPPPIPGTAGAGGAPQPRSPALAPARPPPADVTYGGWLPAPVVEDEADAIVAAVAAERALSRVTQGAAPPPTGGEAVVPPAPPLSTSLSSGEPPGAPAPDSSAAPAAPADGGLAPAAAATCGSVSSAPPAADGGCAPRLVPSASLTSLSSLPSLSPMASPLAAAHSWPASSNRHHPAAGTAGGGSARGAAWGGGAEEPALLLQLGFTKATPLDALRAAAVPRLLQLGALCPADLQAPAGAGEEEEEEPGEPTAGTGSSSLPSGSSSSGAAAPPTALLRRLRLRIRASSRPGRALAECATAYECNLWDGVELAVEVLPEPEAPLAAAVAAATVAASPAAVASSSSTGALFVSAESTSLAAASAASAPSANALYRHGGGGGSGGVALGTAGALQPLLVYVAWFDRARWAVGPRREAMLCRSESLRVVARRVASLPGVAACAQATLDAVAARYAAAHDGGDGDASSSSALVAVAEAVPTAAAVAGGSSPTVPAAAAAAPTTQPPSPEARLRAALRVVVVHASDGGPPPLGELPHLSWRPTADDTRAVGSVATGVSDGCTLLLADSDVPLPPLTAADRAARGIAGSAPQSSSDGGGQPPFAFNFGIGSSDGASGGGGGGTAGGPGRYGAISWDDPPPARDGTGGGGLMLGSKGGGRASAPTSAPPARSASKETGLRILTRAERDAARRAASGSKHADNGTALHIVAPDGGASDASSAPPTLLSAGGAATASPAPSPGHALQHTNPAFGPRPAALPPPAMVAVDDVD